MSINELKKRALQYTLIISVILGATGCSVSKIVPDPATPDTHTPKIHFDTYSYKQESRFTDEQLEKLLLASTNKILGKSTWVDALPESKINGDSYHLQILVKKGSLGPNGLSDWLTGLSLGLIPSWRIDYGMYVFAFNVFKNGRECKLYGFDVNSTGYGHILLLPIGLVQLLLGPHREAQNLYEDALRSVASTGCG